MAMSKAVKVVKSGTGRYAGEVVCDVRIIVQNRDYYYEEGFDTEPPDLNEAGEAYYVQFSPPTERNAFIHRSRTCLSLEEAVKVAEEMSPSEIAWQS